jgi:hypothetical protein
VKIPLRINRFVFLMIAGISIILNAQIPRTISYQGVLTDAKGNPRPDGSYNVTFALYADSTGGTKLWQETKSLAVTKGMFSNYLGDVTALTLTFDRQYWLGITISTGQEFGQRIKLSAAAYSFGAVVADSARKAALSDSAAKAAVAYRVIGSGTGVQADTIKASMVMAKDTNGVKVVSASGVGLTLTGNGNVGIGIATNDPAIKLAVYSGGSTGVLVKGKTRGQILLNTTNQKGWQIEVADDSLGNNPAGALGFTESSVGSRMTLAKGGNVGIGTTNPMAPLEIRRAGGAGAVQITIDNLPLLGDFSRSAIFTIKPDNPNDIGGFLFKTNNGAQGNINSLSLSPTGNVGIGTTIPQGTLNVKAHTNGWAGGLTLTSNNSSYKWRVHPEDGDGSLMFSNDDIKSMLTFQKNGSVGIGTNTPSRQLHLNTTTGPNLRLETNGSNAAIEFIPSVSSGRYNWVAGAQYNISDAFEITPSTAVDGMIFSNPAFLIKSNGNVGIGTTTPCSKLQVKGTITADEAVVVNASCTSDRRFKTILAPITSALDKIKRLSGVLFTWKRAEYPDRNFPEGAQIGLIAQDVEKVLPELVHTDDEGYKSLSYDKLTAVLVEAVKEQQAMIDSLRTEVASMKVQLGLK